MMEIHIFWGDLTDVLARKDPLGDVPHAATRWRKSGFRAEPVFETAWYAVREQRRHLPRQALPVRINCFDFGDTSVTSPRFFFKLLPNILFTGSMYSKTFNVVLNRKSLVRSIE